MLSVFPYELYWILAKFLGNILPISHLCIHVVSLVWFRHHWNCNGPCSRPTVRVMKFFTWITMKSQKGHIRHNAFLCIDMHIRVLIHWAHYRGNQMGWICDVSCIKDLIPFFYIYIESAALAANEELFITWTSVIVVQNQGTRIWRFCSLTCNRKKKNSPTTILQHIRHINGIESFNAETRTHIKQIFPFIHSFCWCSAKGGRCCQIFQAAFRYRNSVLFLISIHSLFHSHTLDKSGTRQSVMSFLANTSHLCVSLRYMYGFWRYVKCSSVIVILRSCFCLVVCVCMSVCCFCSTPSFPWDGITFMKILYIL